jgi:hypothetical protein
MVSVVLTHVEGNPALNGAEGTILDFDPATMAYKVQMGSVLVLARACRP